jgi:hypothetical protein
MKRQERNQLIIGLFPNMLDTCEQLLCTREIMSFCLQFSLYCKNILLKDKMLALELTYQSGCINSQSPQQCWGPLLQVFLSSWGCQICIFAHAIGNLLLFNMNFTDHE